jgi:F-type H+-transporting ATPase subunit gamma
VLISSDKGLCGGFNSNVVKRTLEFMRDNGDRQFEFTLVGKKVNDAFKRRGFAVVDRYTDVFFRPAYAHAATIGGKLLDAYLSRSIDEVVIIYNEFKSMVSQKVKCETLLPLPALPAEHGKHKAAYIFEPEGRECLDELLSKYFLYQIWRAILESYAAEQSARMAAMNGATKNAGELIEKFTLFYNKARQGSITKELLEVVSGAESLR